MQQEDIQVGNKKLAAHIEELERVNAELRQARRAALNLMEDAIFSKEALRKSEEKTHVFTAIVPVLLWQMDASGATISGNERWIEYTGQSFDSHDTDGWLGFVHPDDAAATAALFADVSKKREYLELEQRIRRYDGEYRWFFVREVAIRNPGGEVIQWFGAATDIHELKMAEGLLRQSEVRFHTLADAVPQIMWTNDGNGIANYFNQRWYAYSGLSNEESIGLGWEAIVHPDDAKISQSIWNDAKIAGQIFDTEYRLRNVDGHYRWHLGRNVPLIGKEKQIIGWFGTATDIEDLKQAQSALAISEERFRIALNSAEMAAWDWNLKDDQIIWNDQHYFLLGLQPDGKLKCAADFIKFIHPDDVTQVSGKLAYAIDHSGLYEAEFRIVKPNKSVCWMHGYGRVVTSVDGKAMRMAGVMQDINIRKKLEQQKEDFLGIASHELRTPVTSIKVYAEILQERFEGQGRTEDAKLMGKMNEQINRLTMLIGDLLDATKTAEGKLPLYPTEFEINELIKEKLEDLQRISAKHHLTLKDEGDISITADRDRIGQVLTNLISNAIKYSPAGGEVTISTKKKSTGIMVSVHDTGIGIPEHLKNQVFDRFFRATNPLVESYPGMGLGLYISAGIIERHHGAISVDSGASKGTLFKFFLPYKYSSPF